MKLRVSKLQLGTYLNLAEMYIEMDYNWIRLLYYECKNLNRFVFHVKLNTIYTQELHDYMKKWYQKYVSIYQKMFLFTHKLLE